MRGIHLSVAIKGLESDFLGILARKSKEKLVDLRGDIGEEILGFKTSSLHQALRFLGFIIVEIERVLLYLVLLIYYVIVGL